MIPRIRAALPLALTGFVLAATSGTAQPPGGPGGFGPPGGFGGPPGGQTRKLLKQFDKNSDGWLNAEERKAAREEAKKGGRGGRGFGPPGGFGRGNQDPPKPGAHVETGEVKAYPGVPLYEPTILRTLFLDFENKDWEAELQDFHGTDVEVPCTLTVDGKKYPNVGVHFRGMSSYMGVSAGYKRSLNLSLDLADKKQRLYGSKTLNLLNSHEDATFLSTVLYSHVARQYVPCPKANFVKVVINGESWGVYVNAQQFDKAFVKENYKTEKGDRWKVRGNPGGRGGLEYWGDKVEDYKRVFDLKHADDEEKAWKALVNLCRVLNETPPDKLEEALKPVLDVDSVLWFLALDVAVINGDGYWTRASDYSLYRDPKGKFHLIPSDMNECFRPAGGPGGFMVMRGPQPGEVLPSFLQDMLQLTGEQKKQVGELQKETQEKLDRLLTPEQRKQLKEMRDRGPGAVAFGGPPGGPGGPGGFGPPGGPGAGGGRGGLELDPLVGLNNTRMPLRSKLLAVPALKARYLACVKTIAEKSFDWKQLGPVVAKYRDLIEAEVKADTRKLEPYEDFVKYTADTAPAAAESGGRRGPPNGMNLRAFADGRRKYLLDYTEPKKATP